MITDPVFYAVAVPAVFLVGMGKGGFGGAMAIVAVSIMALRISPVAAAAIMLPILVLMDIAGLAIYRRKFDTTLLKLMIPATTIGVGVGYVTASYVDEDFVRLLIGTMALAFSLDYWFRPARTTQAPPSAAKGWICGALSGFTSFVSHAGAPPYQFYALPLRLERTLYVGTTIVLFSYVNAIKLVPYFMLGQFNTSNLLTSAVLLPLAPVSIWAGAWLVKRIPQETFYRYLYAFILILSLKLIWDGAEPFFAG